MTIAIALGAGIGAGLCMIARGFWPPRLSLAEALAAPRRASRAAVALHTTSGNAGLLARVGRPIARAWPRDAARQLTDSVRNDLAVLERSPEQHLAEKLSCALVGLLLIPLVVALLGVSGIDLPLFLAPLPSILLAIAGFLVPDLAARSEAAKRRRELRRALSAFIDLTVVSLAGGSGVEGALQSAAEVGDGPAFRSIRHALDGARLAREAPWTALERLGREMGVPELEETAASVGLSGTEGARVRQSLAARAASLRSHRRADAEAEAHVATQRMTVTMVLLLIGFLAFVLFPAYVRVFASL
jgi:Flp pilus assembly protein TadB